MTLPANLFAPGITVTLNPITPPPSTIGTITQFPLPARPAGATWPFVNNGSSKQCDPCYCPQDNRIVAQGGDTTHSATDGTYSVDATLMNDWRTDVGAPIYPTLVAPHALQDDFGIAWVPHKKQFSLIPGVFSSYDVEGSPINNFCGGAFWYDPATKLYTQDSRYFHNAPTNGVSPGRTSTWTGCPFGGVYDEQTHAWYWFNDNARAVQSLDVDTMTRRPDVPIPASGLVPPAAHPTYKGVYFLEPRPVLIGRVVYIMGWYTDGTVAGKAPGFWGWNIDTGVWSVLAPAPVVMASQLLQCLNQSKGQVVWLKIDGPDGIIKGIYIYSPSGNAWSQDTQPLATSVLGNVSCSLPDGRIFFAGSSLGTVQQTMANFYSL